MELSALDAGEGLRMMHTKAAGKMQLDTDHFPPSNKTQSSYCISAAVMFVAITVETVPVLTIMVDEFIAPVDALSGVVLGLAEVVLEG